MRVRRIHLDAAELKPRLDDDTMGVNGTPVYVGLADGAVSTWLTEGQLYEIAEAWRSAYDAVIEARHGVSAVI